MTTTVTAGPGTGPAAPTPDAARSTPARFPVLDGLRGLAIVLVVLSHLTTVWPQAQRADLGVLDALFESGSPAVTIFFVVSGYLVTAGLVRARAQRGMGATVSGFVRRLVRITLQVAALVAVVLVVAEVDPTDTHSRETTEQSAAAVLTYTWNEYVRTHVLDARSDLGPLYYLSIETQFFVALLVLVLLLGGRRRGRMALAALVAVAIPVVTWWQWYVHAQDGWFDAALMTTTRMDGLLWGSLLALTLPRLFRVGGLRRQAGALLGAGALVLSLAIGSTAFTDISAYFGIQGLAVAVATTALVAGVALGTSGASLGERLLSHPKLAWLGAASLTIFAWHLPVFEAVSRHTHGWHPLARTSVALIAVVVVVILVERYVATPVRRALERTSRA